jgi:hypothetical protein
MKSLKSQFTLPKTIMKQLCILSLPFTLFLLLQNAVSAQTPLSNPNPSQTLLIEAEHFTDYGGWVHRFCWLMVSVFR